MSAPHAEGWTRRRFLGGLTVAGTAGLLGLYPRPVAAEPPPETTRLRLIAVGSSCVAPQFVAAEELLQAEGFADVQYVKTDDGQVEHRPARAMASGTFDLVLSFLTTQLLLIDKGAPVLILAGGHAGCIELFAQPAIRSPRDLKGKRVAVDAKDAFSPSYTFLASFVASVGLDVRRDLEVVAYPNYAESMHLFADGQIDAVVVGPPVAQALRAQQRGHVLFDNGRDQPWSQYFCCMVAGHREFVRTHPVATKRALRAILKGNQVCALEPERVAKSMVDTNYLLYKAYGEWGASYKYVLESLKELPYAAWREYDPEDTIRFYALRLHEVGMIKSTPQKLIAQGTDWRFLNELKKELKG
jgi:NitT/TauT family transport system substrate-binding protein